MAESAESFENLMMGEVSETLSESDEKFAEKIRASQVKIKQIRKDESIAKQYDQHLAQVVREIEPELLEVIIFLLDEEIGSLTILSVLSLADSYSAQVCWNVFHEYITEKADFTELKVSKKHNEMLSYWWTFILGAETISQEKKLNEFRHSIKFIGRFSQSLATVLNTFVRKNQVKNMNNTRLKTIISQYQTKIFSA